MTRSRLTRAVLAVPAALSLALGGALLAAAPASAIPGAPIDITSPAPNATDVARTVDISGTGSDGAGVALTDASGTTLIGNPTTVAPGGAWTISVTFAPDAPAAQTITATQVIDPLNAQATTTTDQVSFTLAAPVPVVPEPLDVTSPTSGTTTDSRIVEFVGTATPGAEVAANVDGAPFGGITADSNGDFVFEAEFPIGIGEDITVNVTAVNPDGTSATPVDIELTLPAPLASPVITSPTTGSTIAGGGAVTFRGTGIAGQTVALVILPDQATIAANPNIDPLSLFPSAVVATDGSFVINATLPLGTYTAVAVHTDTPFDPLTSQALSLPSNEVTFTLAAAPAAAGPRGTELADTGATSTGMVGPAAGLLLVGLLLVAASRRRAARVVTA